MILAVVYGSLKCVAVHACKWRHSRGWLKDSARWHRVILLWLLSLLK